MRTTNYDRFPEIAVPGNDHDVTTGWEAIASKMRDTMAQIRPKRSARVLVMECYVGVFEDEIRRGLTESFETALWLDTRDAFLPEAEIDRLVAPDLCPTDPLFGHMTRLSLENFFSADKLTSFRAAVTNAKGPVIVIGPGAILVASDPDVFVFANLPRWEGQLRQRGEEVSNLGVNNRRLKGSLKYKRSFFIDWRVCDRVKRGTLGKWDFMLDTCVPHEPKLVGGRAYRDALAHCVTRPFRVVPFFDPGPWGGQWMKEVCGLDREQANYAWCFDCVPEENSLFLKFGRVRVEVPAIDLVLAQPSALLGEPAFGRFGPEFPIRFDFLDTMSGGNLSLQVHPLTEYIREHFGITYTQDESYYLLDAKPGAVVYLGRRNDAEFDQMIGALEAAQRGEQAFEADRFVARFPARKHDHFLIPGGTLHCSGRDSMVLEISATPYIFTFKLWDWGRPGMDGKPRPINIDRGKENIRWERDESYAAQRLVNQVREIARGDRWREERTGLHEAQFIETRRHWFTGPTPHDTGGEEIGSVNVLNLVEGEEVVVESPDNAFAPFVVHYAETFIVPAAVGRYQIKTPDGRAASECATIKAFVRSRA